MYQAPVSRPSVAAQTSDILRSLPAEVLDAVGEYLCKQERRKLALADRRLPHASVQLWQRDAVLDHLVPMALQHRVPAHLRPPIIARSEQLQGAPSRQLADEARDNPELAAAWHEEAEHNAAWLGTYRNLRRLEDHVASGAAPLDALNIYCRVRSNGPHLVETLLPMVESNQVVLIGPGPSARVPWSERRKSFSYDLNQPFDRAAVFQHRRVHLDVDDWDSPVQWQTAGHDGLFAFCEADDILRVWRYEHRAPHLLRCLPTKRRYREMRASALSFARTPEGTKLLFCGSLTDDDPLGLHGITFHYPDPSEGQRPHPDLQVREGQTREAEARQVALSLNISQNAATSVSDSGEVSCRPLPFAGDRKFAPTFKRLMPADRWKAAHTSANNDVVALQSRWGGVVVAQAVGGTMQETWRLRGQQGAVKVQLNTEGSRIGLLMETGELQVWPLQPSTLPLCRYKKLHEPIVSFTFSPYSHALLVQGRTTTHVMFPFPEPLSIELPHLGQTANFMPGPLRIVGMHDTSFFDLDLSWQNPKNEPAVD